MSYTVVMDVVNNRATKFIDNFETEEEAQAHIDEFIERWPNAFIVDNDSVPAGPVTSWLFDGQNNVTIVPPPEDISDEEREYRTQRAQIIADSFIPQFIAMTPAQVTNYIETNVTNLASAKTVISKLALMMLLLAKREFKQ